MAQCWVDGATYVIYLAAVALTLKANRFLLTASVRSIIARQTPTTAALRPSHAPMINTRR